MVSSKIILAVVLMACVMVIQAEDGDKKPDSGSSTDINSINNINQIFTEISKNPTQFFTILASSLKNRASKFTGGKDKNTEKEDSKN